MTGPRCRPFNQPWRTYTVEYPQAGLSTPPKAVFNVYQGGKLLSSGPGGIGIYRVPPRPPAPRPPRQTRPAFRTRRDTEAALRANRRKAMDAAAQQTGRIGARSRPFGPKPGTTGQRLLDHLRHGGANRFPYSGPRSLGPCPPTTRFGRQSLNFVNLQKKWQAKQTPLFDGRKLGGCVETTLLRMKAAHHSAYGKDILAGKSQRQREVYDAIGGTRKRRAVWKRAPNKYKFKGAPGALSYLGLADVVEGAEFWKGKADPGAPFQSWLAKPGGPGHSGILEQYIRDEKGRIQGAVVSDQWFNYRLFRKPGPGESSSHISARFRKRD